MGRYRKSVGVGERGQDLHALRHTFTDIMDDVGVPAPIIQLLIGHSRKSTVGTTAIYSQGQRLNLRHAINKFRYSRGVMRLIRTVDGQQRRKAARAGLILGLEHEVSSLQHPFS
jgi:hypothetical protein